MSIHRPESGISDTLSSEEPSISSPEAGKVDQSQMRPKMEKNRKIMDSELDKILSAAQRAKLKEMSGKPNENGPSGFRG